MVLILALTILFFVRLVRTTDDVEVGPMCCLDVAVDSRQREPRNAHFR